MKKPNFIPILLYVLLIAGFLSLILGIFDFGNKIAYSEIIEQFQQENVKSFIVDDNRIYLEFHSSVNNSMEAEGYIQDLELFYQECGALIETQRLSGVLEVYDIQGKSTPTPYDYILPLILGGLVLILVWGLLAGRANANNPMNNFGKARTTPGKAANKVTFQDVAGMAEVKQELQEVVDFLSNPQKYAKIGAKIPHGILLSGSPGTGKTLLARATAGEANVEFLSISGSDFVELYVGVGASRVRDLFDQARKVAPAIIFIDEIDAVGRRRGSGMGGGHDEREQTLNQILVEMDGFSKSEDVIVLAATNRPDILDPALLRPGRFDRQIHVSVPDSYEREQILKVHAKNKCLDDTVDLKAVALSTPGYTGADLSNLLNEAAILAARMNRPALNMEDLNEAMMKVSLGPEKKNRVKLKKDLYATAVHEAGHAIAIYRLPTHDPVRHISIIPRGRSLGTTWTQALEESTHLTRNEMYEQIVGLLGGRAAEILFLNDISTGASSDIDRASKLARDMVGRYGMSDALGTVSYTGGDELFIGRDFERTKSYSEKYAGTIDDEVKLLVDKAYRQCCDILKKEEAKLKATVDFLMANEVMSGQQFADLMEDRPIRERSAISLLDEFAPKDDQ